MAKITNFIYSEGSYIDAYNGKLHLFTPISYVSSKFFPTHYTFAITFTLYEIDASQKNEVSMHFCDPNGAEIGNAFVKLNPMPDELKKNIPRDIISVTLSSSFQNVALQGLGEYYTKVYVNGIEYPQNFPLHIVKEFTYEQGQD